MPSLVVRKIDSEIVQALKTRAGQRGISAEAEHRRILELILLKPKRKSFAEALLAIPTVGHDSDFERVVDDNVNHVFD